MPCGFVSEEVANLVLSEDAGNVREVKGLLDGLMAVPGWKGVLATPLQVAVYLDHPAAVSKLLEAGARTDAVGSIAFNWDAWNTWVLRPPLILACAMGRRDAAALLVRHGAVAQEYPSAPHAVEVALTLGHTAVAVAMVKEGLPGGEEVLQQLAPHVLLDFEEEEEAASPGTPPQGELSLAEACRASLVESKQPWETPLYLALREADPAWVEALLDGGADGAERTAGPQELIKLTAAHRWMAEGLRNVGRWRKHRKTLERVLQVDDDNTARMIRVRVNC
jgi:ankyrin repeat protein